MGGWTGQPKWKLTFSNWSLLLTDNAGGATITPPNAQAADTADTTAKRVAPVALETFVALSAKADARTVSAVMAGDLARDRSIGKPAEWTSECVQLYPVERSCAVETSS